MGYYAIASIQDDNGNIAGARLFDAEKQKLYNARNSEIIAYLNSGKTIYNLGLKRKEIVWTQGKSDRYPIISLNGNITNPNITTVVQVYKEDSNGLKSYTLVAPNGDFRIVKENIAIQLGKRFGFSNCKVTSKDGSMFISSISGNIPELSISISFKIINREDLYIKLPLDGSVDTIEIPDIVGGISTDTIKRVIYTQPQLSALIKKITFPARMKFAFSSWFSYTRNLEEVEFKGVVAPIDSAFKNLKRLRIVKAQQIQLDYTNEIFLGCESLKEFKITNQVRTALHNKTFEGCTQLDINKVIRDLKVSRLENSIFGGITCEKLVIPASVVSIGFLLFDGIKGLKEIYIAGRNTNIVSGPFSGEGHSAFQFDSQVTMYVKRKSKTYERIQEMGEENFKNLNIAFLSEDKDEEIFVAKALLLGKDLGDSVSLSEAKFIELLKMTKKEDIVNFMHKVMQDWLYTNSGNLELHTYNVIICYPMYGREVKCYTVDDNYVLNYKSKTYIVVTDKDLLLQITDSRIPTNRFKRKRFIPEKDAFELPIIMTPQYGKIDKITFNKDLHTCEVVYRNKEKVRFEYLKRIWRQ